MYFRLLFAALVALGLAGTASAQNTAQPVITGYLTTSGCPSTALTPCFVQYGAGGASTVTIGAPLGPQTGAASIAVICNSGCSGGPSDESAFTAGTSSITTGGFFQTTATSNPLTNGQAGSVQLTANRAFMVNLRNAAGAELGLSAAPLQVGLASGNVASGSYASGALAAGSGTDGWDVTEGTKADAAWTSGSGSVIALLKAAVAGVTAAIPAATAPYGIIGGVISGADTYNTVAASQTTQALTGGSGGATGDYLSHCTVLPTSTSPGVVTIIDNATTIYAFPGGSSSTSNLVPFTIPIGAVSTSGAWKVTTGANLTVTCVGKFH